MGGFLLFLLLMMLLWFSYQFGREAEQEELHDQRQVLDAEWTALEQTRQVNDVFYRARDAMRQAEVDATDQERRRRS